MMTIVAMSLVAGVMKVASQWKKHRETKNAWRQDTEEIQENLGDVVKRRHLTINVLLTKEEAEALEDSAVGQFLADRAISEEAAEYLKRRAS